MTLSILLFIPLLVSAKTDRERVDAHIRGYYEALKYRNFDHYLTQTFEHYCVRRDGYFQKKTRVQYIEELNNLPGRELHVQYLNLLNFTKDRTTMTIYGTVGDATFHLKGRRMTGWYQFYEQVDTACPPDPLTTVMIDYKRQATEIAVTLIKRLMYKIRNPEMHNIWEAITRDFTVEWYEYEGAEKRTQVFPGDELRKYPTFNEGADSYTLTIKNARWDQTGNILFDLQRPDGSVNSTFEAQRTATTDIFYRLVRERKHNFYDKPPGLEYDKILHAKFMTDYEIFA